MQTGVLVQIDQKKQLVSVLIEGKNHALFQMKISPDQVIGSCLRVPLQVLGQNLLVTRGGKKYTAFRLTGFCRLAGCRSKLPGNAS
jgi:hypothetical protein